MDTLELEVENLTQKIKHYLITTIGTTEEHATDSEFYRAFSYVLKEEVMINWTATMRTLAEKKVRKLYYFSMEYMPGRQLGNNITNLQASDLVCRVLKNFKRSLKRVQHVEPDIGIGNGGLGRLASCLLDSLATLQYPAMGYGLRYQYGIFEQELWCGVQIERPDCWLLEQNPWEFRRDSDATLVQMAGKANVCSVDDKGCYDLVDYEELRALPYDLPIVGYKNGGDLSVLTLRLWSTKESPRNFLLQKYNAGHLGSAQENTSLTDVLYPNDNHDIGKRIRLKQEFLLVAASLQDIVRRHMHTFGSIDLFGDKVRIQINDTHPALAIAELTRILMSEHSMPFEQALETTQNTCSYTNHTILKEALEEWEEERLTELLPRQHAIIEKINAKLLDQAKKTFPNNSEIADKLSIIQDGMVKMAHLAIAGSHHINGVAMLHTKILKESVFEPFCKMMPDKFINVTNGVTQRRWLLHANPGLAAFISERIGSDWVTDFGEMKKLAKFATDKASQEAFLAIKQQNKRRLLDYLTREDTDRFTDACRFQPDDFLDETALFDVLVKRIHEYKRQLMMGLHTYMLYRDIKEGRGNQRIKRMIFFGGKAAPGYTLAKDIIRFIYCLSRVINNDKDVNETLRVAFIGNYNVTKAEVLIPATDLSEQISTAGMEASGTGNMKFAINGALTIGTDDGANVEMRESVTDNFWPFKFGNSADTNLKVHKENSYNARSVYESNPYIKAAVDALENRSLTENDAEHESLCNLSQALLHPCDTCHGADRYFILNDLEAYYETQKKVEDLYQDKYKWAEYALQNMAAMGPFSTDTSIRNYANNIWGIEPCPPDPDLLKSVRDDYSEHDRCKVVLQIKPS